MAVKPIQSLAVISGAGVAILRLPRSIGRLRPISVFAQLITVLLLLDTPVSGREVKQDTVHGFEYNRFLMSFAAYRLHSKLCFTGEDLNTSSEMNKILGGAERNLTTRVSTVRRIGGFEHTEAERKRRYCSSVNASRHRYFAAKVRYNRFFERHIDNAEKHIMK